MTSSRASARSSSALTRAIVNKILHDPVTALRRHQAARGESFYIEAARSLFRLEGDDPGDEEE